MAALAEFGDKTQLLALVLVARFRAPVPILAGIATSTLCNHFVAGALGTLLAAWLRPQTARWLLAAIFLAAALWMLIPDRRPDAPMRASRFGAFGTALVSFFIMEMGDKTQIATVALAARYHTVLPVALGTTLGILLADAPVVLFGDAAASRIPLRLVNRIAATVFVVLGVVTLFGHGPLG